MRKQQQGLSLIELLISLTLGIILMTGVAQMFLTSRETYTTQQSMSLIQESGRMAMDYLARDVRMAGYKGCMPSSPDLVRNERNALGLEDEDGLEYQFFTEPDLRGFPAADAPDELDARDGTEVLVLRRASSGSASVVDHVPNNARMEVLAEAEDNCLLNGELCQGELAVITNCTSDITIFRTTGIGNGGAGANVAHGQGAPGGGGDEPTNEDPRLGIPMGEPSPFGQGSQLMAFSTIVYYVAPSEFNEDADVNSLWQRIGENDPVELVQGVKNMSVEYGLDTEAPAGVPDTYRSVEEVEAAEEAGNDDEDWDNVQAVRIHLLLEGMENNATPSGYAVDFGGTEVDSENGRIMQVFSSTIGIRSQLN